MNKIPVLLVGVVVGAAIVYFGVMKPSAVPVNTSLATGAIEYNCALSGGEFDNGTCVCPLESFQTLEEVYDTKSGFCLSTIGGPSGNAGNASIGLPWGAYAYYQNIVVNLCEKSGGNFLNICNCSANKTYSQETGQCE